MPPGASLASSGSGRAFYRSDLSYRATVGFFDRTLARDGFQDRRRTATGTSTRWWVRRADGTSALVAVRGTHPITIEVFEAPAAEPTPMGVTNAQPPDPSAR
jgi:hypothetical protein